MSGRVRMTARRLELFPPDARAFIEKQRAVIRELTERLKGDDGEIGRLEGVIRNMEVERRKLLQRIAELESR